MRRVREVRRVRGSEGSGVEEAQGLRRVRLAKHPHTGRAGSIINANGSEVADTRAFPRLGEPVSGHSRSCTDTEESVTLVRRSPPGSMRFLALCWKWTKRTPGPYWRKTWDTCGSPRLGRESHQDPTAYSLCPRLGKEQLPGRGLAAQLT